eukprot:Sspe_Gene.8072::Locus_2750_Transcript_1_1_Confidence_1.000_Length_1021::g.8072::m.8072
MSECAECGGVASVTYRQKRFCQVCFPYVIRGAKPPAKGDGAPKEPVKIPVMAKGSKDKVRVHGVDVLVYRSRSGEYMAIDSGCYHMGGPLAEGSIEEVPDLGPCVKCPWHGYRIQLSSGRGVVQGCLKQGAAPHQRVHRVTVDSDGHPWVAVSTEGSYPSDMYSSGAVGDAPDGDAKPSPSSVSIHSSLQ